MDNQSVSEYEENIENGVPERMPNLESRMDKQEWPPQSMATAREEHKLVE